MKRIRANRLIENGTATTRREEITPSSSADQVLDRFSSHRVGIDADGREHFAVPLIGPKHRPGTPYLIAHFSLPPPEVREALLDELARTFARAAVDELLKESSLDRFSD